MNRFTIKDVENLCGIKAHTLRIWEKRYGISSPKRKESKHRIYDSDDLKYLLRIAYLYHKGLKISTIASLPPDELKRETTRRGGAPENNDLFIKELTEASIVFDTAQFEETFHQCLKSMSLEKMMVNVLYPYLEKIGLLWLTDHIIPAQEHFSSNLINRKLLVAINDLTVSRKANARKLMLFAPVGEPHEIPLLFSYYLLKKNGDEVIYYGPNIKPEEPEHYTSAKPVTHFHLHLITALLPLGTNDYIRKLAGKYPAQTIVVSGPRAAEVVKPLANVRLLLSLDSFLQFCSE